MNAGSTSQVGAAAGYGAWLASFTWDHILTLTFRAPAAVERARRSFLRMVRWLERSAGERVDWFYSFEPSHDGRGIHIHALLAGTSSLTVDEVSAAWKDGFTRVARFDPKRAGAKYVTKGINLPSTDYDCSKRLRPSRAFDE